MTDKKPENPPAFPVAVPTEFYHAHDGMTLRDWFAGQALASIPNRSWDYLGEGAALIEAWALCAYAVADAMLAEREKNDAG